MVPVGPSCSLATRPSLAPELCPLPTAGPGCRLPGGPPPSEGSPTPSLFAVNVSPAAGEVLTHSLAGSGVSVNQFETRRAALPQSWREGCAGSLPQSLFLLGRRPSPFSCRQSFSHLQWYGLTPIWGAFKNADSRVPLLRLQVGGSWYSPGICMLTNTYSLGC